MFIQDVLEEERNITMLFSPHEIFVGAHLIVLHAGLHTQILPRLAPPPVVPNGHCSDPFVSKLTGGIGQMVGILEGVGGAVGIIGIIVGGLMRATSFGNERRIAASNTAITCAVVGLVIVLLAVSLGTALPTWFGQSTCTIQTS